MIAKLYVTILAAMAFSSVIPTSAIARDISEARAAAIWDSTICYGRLDNGLTYYIKHNESPKNRAEFYIVQKVGSINEEESQRGLAHFLEHMAFNGTKNFPGKKIINYLQENGVSFGADLNAYTSIDQTVYNISNVPARKALVDSCLLILHDWSGFITLDNDEIDAERKVIHEEWRTTRDASKRIYEQLLPKMFPNGNRYAHRIPIGLMSVVDNFPHQALREYYHKWYRPDLQGIIVVGDINPQEIEARIKSLWSDIPAKRNAAERIYIEVPDNDAPIVAIAKDKEMTQNSIEVDFKYNPLSDVERKSSLGQRDRYIRAMITSMLSKRLGELMLEPRPPFMSSYVDDGSYVFAQTKNAFVAGAYYKENNWSEALTAVVKELKRAYLYGFTNGEYNREIAISESAND